MSLYQILVFFIIPLSIFFGIILMIRQREDINLNETVGIAIASMIPVVNIVFFMLMLKIFWDYYDFGTRIVIKRKQK